MGVSKQYPPPSPTYFGYFCLGPLAFLLLTTFKLLGFPVFQLSMHDEGFFPEMHCKHVYTQLDLYIYNDIV